MVVEEQPVSRVQPFAGLLVLMTVLNNWDIKTQQNAISRTSVKGWNRNISV